MANDNSTFPVLLRWWCVGRGRAYCIPHREPAGSFLAELLQHLFRLLELPEHAIHILHRGGRCRARDPLAAAAVDDLRAVSALGASSTG